MSGRIEPVMVDSAPAHPERSRRAEPLNDWNDWNWLPLMSDVPDIQSGGRITSEWVTDLRRNAQLMKERAAKEKQLQQRLRRIEDVFDKKQKADLTSFNN